MKTEKWTIEFNQDVPNQYIINDDNGRICYIAPQPDCLRLPQDRLEGKIAAFIVDACNNYERVRAQRDELAAALSQFMTWLDDGTLVRDITGDNQPGWSIKMIEFVRQLQLARAALAKLEDK